MEKKILQSLSQHYFQGIADDISNAKQISAIFPNMSDLGDVRENVLLKFLQLHLPSRCSVLKGGCVFDSSNNCSKQIDLLVVNDFSLKFSYFDRDSQNSKNVQTIEGCLAAISVKSTLDKKELHEALLNLSSIPPMPDSMVEKINPQLYSRESFLGLPKKAVFSFSGQSVEKTMEHIGEFYKEHDSLKDYQRADLIIVNNSFCIERIGKGGGKTRNGSSVPEGTYHPMFNGTPGNQKKFGTLPLFWLLNTIQKTTLFSPHVLFDYQNYIDAMDFHATS